MFGNKLKKILDKKNISQKKMAEDLKISQNSITNWIKNKSKPTKENINKISEYLNIDIEYWEEDEKEKIKNINYGNYSKNGDTYNNNNNNELPYITLAIIEELKKIPEEEQADLFKALKNKKNKDVM